MAVEERSIDKYLYKITLYFLKIIPMIMALCDILNTMFCYFGIDLPILSYIGGISFLSLAFLYLVSYVFRFCFYHRMFLHYIAINNIINIIDFYFIPVPYIMYFILIGFLLFGILYCHIDKYNIKIH